MASIDQPREHDPEVFVSDSVSEIKEKILKELKSFLVKKDSR